MEKDCVAKDLEVNGIVQGVGFRPFVYKLANRYDVSGVIANTSSGVSIHLEGPREDIESFCFDLSDKSPPLAHITKISIQNGSLNGHKDFAIVKSRSRDFKATLISPDVSICDDCLNEMLDPEDRRYQYPFINCTNCGPRYTIIDNIPYDRPSTSMKHFKMCQRCQAEYDDPVNRRFHAQPNACPDCGPHLTLYNKNREIISSQAPIEKAAELLKQGQILAIKGLGGFHLSADAENKEAVAGLRKRKHREEKPFAVMSYDLERIREYAHIDIEEELLIKSFQRPIVLLKKKRINSLSGHVAPRNKYFGTMLPYTPLHYLLLNQGFKALVMTSGNMSEEPIVIDNESAFERLSVIADYFLVHNRDIYLRSDDSIVKRTAGATRFIRRSRGYVPIPIFLKKDIPPILACGAELKNTICLTKKNQAFLSQHIGDLENLETYKFLELTVAHMKRILDIDPKIIAYDLHPDYLSTRYAKVQEDVTMVPVQHHHAHIVSCMAENMLEGPVIGLAFDGAGYGSDGCIWGGEILIAEEGGFERAGQLSYAPMPGSAQAVREPWRMAVSYLHATFGEDFRNLDLPMLDEIDPKKIDILVRMISRNINCPATSSLGRLFDGIAAILGIRNNVFFEGQAAVELEMLTDEEEKSIYAYEWTSGDVHKILFEPLIYGAVKDMEQGVQPAVIGGKFHLTLIHMFSDLCEVIRKERGLDRVVLSGGVFQNSLLLRRLVRRLEEKSFQVFTHKLVPANDGGISLGQALVAAAVTKD